MARIPIKPLLINIPELSKLWHPIKNSTIPLETVTIGSDKKVWWQCSEKHEWEQIINAQSKIISCPYCNGSRLLSGFNDLSITHPEFLILWDYEANHCQPLEIIYRNNTSLRWKCSLGHKWEATLGNVKKAKVPCPFCGGRELLQGFNDLQTCFPDLLVDWDYNKNTKQPFELQAASVTVYSWVCKAGHSYLASTSTRIRGRGCPICSGKQVLIGETDAATIYPHLVKEWDGSVVGNISLTELSKGSNKKIHWVCKHGHQFTETVPARGAGGRGCPTCSGKRTLSGFNDIATTFPEVAAEWHPHKNGDLLPSQFIAGSHAKVWWLGSECKHEWQAAIYHRAGNKRGCSVCAGKNVVSGFNDALTVAPAHLITEFDNEKNHLTLSDYTRGSEKKVWWKCSKGHEWEAMIRNRLKLGHNCPQCSSNVSKAEKEIADYLTPLFPDIQTSSRKVIDRFELDMYIPSKNIAIEYNGVHWHSSANDKITPRYHYDKWKACKEKNIQLIQIWEDEWNRNPEQIKRMLKRKLGISNEHRIFARKTTIATLPKVEAESFLQVNHIQGYAAGTYYLGLKECETGELVAVLVLKKEAGTKGKVLNIIRYATSANVIGGFTKLLTYATKTYQPESYLTFSDHCVSDGGLYENNGFIADKEFMPDYMYVVGNVRRHKFGYRLKRFRNDPDLIWEEGLTERELSDLNGLKRIWDAGKTRWVLTASK